jgi:hypothetical protein
MRYLSHTPYYLAHFQPLDDSGRIHSADPVHTDAAQIAPLLDDRARALCASVWYHGKERQA